MIGRPSYVMTVRRHGSRLMVCDIADGDAMAVPTRFDVARLAARRRCQFRSPMKKRHAEILQRRASIDARGSARSDIV